MILSKERMTFENGNVIEGIRISLAPKMSKFFSLVVNGRSDNLQILKTFNQVVYNWYQDAQFGQSCDWHRFIDTDYDSKENAQHEAVDN